jgi:hypothetical protein
MKNRVRLPTKFPTKKHFFTLAATLEEGFCAVKRFPNKNTIFINEVKDLAQLLETHSARLSLNKLGTYDTY